MARKKRKYIRRKPLRQDTVPLSSLVVGLLPILLMTGIVGVYLVYQYTDIFSQTSVPSLIIPSLPNTPNLPTVQVPALQFPEIHLPSIQFPEITFSFTEVIAGVRNGMLTTLDFLVSSSEVIVRFFGKIFSLLFGSLHGGLVSVITGIGLLIDFFRDTIAGAYSDSVIYIRTVSWTVSDFFYFLDLPGKVQAFFNVIFWPFHFLDPRPAVEATSTKLHETNRTIANTFAPLGPIIDYVWKTLKETAAQLVQGIVEMWNFLNWLASQSK